MASLWDPSTWSLNLIGLLSLADIQLVQRCTAKAGTASYLDALVLCPGMHLQQQANDLNKGEYPACAAMTTGYVFRVENPATVHYMQNVGRTGHLTTLQVENARFKQYVTTVAEMLYFTAAIAGIQYVLSAVAGRNWPALALVSMQIAVRLINIFIIRRRTRLAWKGASEPKTRGDLLILMSQDRWIRLQGMVDDLKAVTSGEWMREPTVWETATTAFATLLQYTSVVVAANLSFRAQAAYGMVIAASVALVMVSDMLNRDLWMCGCVVSVRSPPKAYTRRLDLARELIAEHGNSDWAVKMGMINAEQAADMKAKRPEPVIM